MTFKNIFGRFPMCAAAIGVYCLLGIALIAQKPGLQYDEAMLVAGALHLEHSAVPFELENTPQAWVCPFHHCVPLMAFLYVGAAKEYANFPLFVLFGPRASLIRMVSLLFGALAIWGMFRLVDPWFGRRTAALSAFALAINPAFLNMVIFDNGATAGLLAGLGLTCACVALYATRRSTVAAFGLGVAMGFGVWSRANFIWLLVAGVAAGLILFRRRLLVPLAHLAAIVCGGIAGGFPFLFYQYVSQGATWKAQGQVASTLPLSALVRQRIFLFADTLLSDGEHRQMWDGPPLPAWQLWLFPCIVLIAGFVCLVWSGREEPRRRLFAQFLTLTFWFTGAILFLSRLPVAEHHFILVVPLAIAMVVLAGSIVQNRVRQAWVVFAAIGAVYGASCLYWEFRTVRGLRETGGVDVWSNAGLELAQYLDQSYGGRQIKIVDWGYQYNMYLLTGGRIAPREIFAGGSDDASRDGRQWLDEIREGGVFLLRGPDSRDRSMRSTNFLRILAAAHPNILQRRRVMQRNGSTYAEVIEIAPNSVREKPPGAPAELTDVQLRMDDPRIDDQLTGLYPPEGAGYRWSRREFSATADLSPIAHAGTGDVALVMRFNIPESTLRRLGPLTLSASFGGHALAPEVLARAGPQVFFRHLDTSWIRADKPVRMDFSLDKALHGVGSDPRELGLVVHTISVEPE